MLPRIHYFNPGHETAILQGTANYTPPKNVKCMTKDLTALPLWYADLNDYVWMEEALPASFLSELPKEVHPFPIGFTTQNISCISNDLPQAVAEPWGVSPHSIRLFEQLQKNTSWPISIPKWQPSYQTLSSRVTAAQCLDRIKELLPDMYMPMTPLFCHELPDVLKAMEQITAPCIIKTPFSSSGRGLLWPKASLLTEKEQQWVEGALSKQGSVSVEQGLNKVSDYGLEFYIDGKGGIRYEGLSCFICNQKGAYEQNLIGSQSYLESILYKQIGRSFDRLKEAVTEAVRQIYANDYQGYLGVDMLVYRSAEDGHLALHPCVEVNLRFTMGLVAIRLAKRLHPDFRGSFQITYDKDQATLLAHHRSMQQSHPLALAEGKLRSGYLNLCPITPTTHYRAYIVG